VYYAGHGIVPMRQKILYLATKKTRFDKPQRTGAIAAHDDLVSLVVEETKAKNILFIIDGGFSARIKEEGAINRKEGQQIFFITAASSIKTAKDESPVNVNYTAFTHELLHILEHGIDGVGEFLTVQDISNQLIKQLKDKNLPVPQFSSHGQPDELEICKNSKQNSKCTASVSVSRLPSSLIEHFVGREDTLKILDNFLYSSSTNIAIIAWGGVGKTTLINKWRATLAKHNWKNIEKVFDWSFYSQGTNEEQANSAEDFLDSALRWFGDTQPNYGSSWQKGDRLADLIQNYRTLLILDGLEQLQHPYKVNSRLGGRIKDLGLSTLLKRLADKNLGLCVITTRVPITDLSIFIGSTCNQIQLDDLSIEEGTELLSYIGVNGKKEKLYHAVIEVCR
jgi:hypothetical protein